MKRIIGVLVSLLFASSLVFASNAKAGTYYEIAVRNYDNWCITSDHNPLQGATVYLYTCYNNSNQHWGFVAEPHGAYLILFQETASGTQLCIQENLAYGDTLRLWPCDASNNDQLWFAGTSSSGGYVFENVNGLSAIANNGNVKQDYNAQIKWHYIYPTPAYEDYDVF